MTENWKIAAGNLQVRLPAEARLTLVALEGFVAGVQLHVDVVAGSGRQDFAAYFAGLRFALLAGFLQREG